VSERSLQPIPESVTLTNDEFGDVATMLGFILGLFQPHEQRAQSVVGIVMHPVDLDALCLAQIEDGKYLVGSRTILEDGIAHSFPTLWGRDLIPDPTHARRSASAVIG